MYPRILALWAVILIATPASAFQDPLAIRKAVEVFLQTQTQGLPGQVSITVGPIDQHNQLFPCDALEVSLPAGGRAWGRTSVLVRCQRQGGWSQYVSAQIRVKGAYFVATRALNAGHMLGEGDIAPQQGDMTDLPGNVITDPQLALGRILIMPTAAGRPLRGDLLRQTNVIQPGQTVKVVSRGAGFQVSSEGQALNGAAEGQVVRVRTVGGQVVSGLARSSGTVEITY